MATTQMFQIVSGPSREELFDCLRLRHEGRTIRIRVVNMYDQNKPRRFIEVDMVIDGISIEGDSGNSWFIEFYDSKKLLGGEHFIGFLSTKTRAGHIKAGRRPR